MDNPYIIEVIELHQFFQDWFRGVLPNTDEAFARCARSLSADFTIISPDGILTPADKLLLGIRQMHGRLPQFKLWVENPVCRALGDGIQLVTYEEWQKREGETTARLSSALFRPNPQVPNSAEWLHVHETWFQITTP